MGSKDERKNQHAQNLNKKIRHFEKRLAKELEAVEKSSLSSSDKSTKKIALEKRWATEGLKKEAGFTSDGSRPEFKTGREADSRTKRSS
jgi:hypothetical protein